MLLMSLVAMDVYQTLMKEVGSRMGGVKGCVERGLESGFIVM